jgi:diguanylate cyclase (GGDEF)-like protein
VGDEFTVIAEDIRHAQDAAVVGQKIVDALAPSIVIQEREFFVTPSVGISLYPVDAQDDVNLLKNADAAMYYVKRHGRNNYQLYSPDLDTQANAPT